MAVMDLRESLEEASTEEEVAGVAEENAQHLEESVQALGEAFQGHSQGGSGGSSGSAGQGVEWDVEAVRKQAVALRYWSNIAKACKEWESGKRIELQH
jgi:molecular chaperone HscB